VVLAKNMIGLYNTNALYYQRIRQINRDACGLLLRMMEAKGAVEAGQWTPALDVRLTPFHFHTSSSFSSTD
jgi:nuclear pore complex protein Nup93